jgi:hypothetical protein
LTVVAVAEVVVWVAVAVEGLALQVAPVLLQLVALVAQEFLPLLQVLLCLGLAVVAVVETGHLVETAEVEAVLTDLVMEIREQTIQAVVVVVLKHRMVCPEWAVVVVRE